MTFHHRRNIGQYRRHRVATTNAPAGKRRGQSATPFIGLSPGIANGSVYDCRIVRVDTGGTLNKVDGGKDRVIGADWLEALIKN